MSIPIPVSILIVDDQPTRRNSLIAMLNDDPGLSVIGETTVGSEAVEKVSALEPDVVVLNTETVHVGCTLLAEQIMNLRHSSRIIIVSQTEEEEHIRECMKVGASGYILKRSVSEELPYAIKVVHDGGHFFSPAIAKRIVGFYLKSVAPIQQN